MDSFFDSMKSALVVLLSSAALLGWITFMVHASAWQYAHELKQAELEQRAPRDIYPAIPQCDKPLWDRIAEGCDE
jgi:hypothetical protein